MKSLQSKLSTRLCLLAIATVPTIFLPSIAGATTSLGSSTNETVNFVSPIQVSANLSEKLIAISPQTGTAGLAQPAFVRSTGWVQQGRSRSVKNQATSDKSSSAADIFNSL